MEFPDAGKHCSKPDCKQLDFLPFLCDGCRRYFCKEHQRYADHRCPSPRLPVTIPVCPICQLQLSIQPGEDINARVSRHLDRECHGPGAVAAAKPTGVTHCTVPGCERFELVPVRCSDCRQTVCVKHRLPEKHHCRRLPKRGSGSRSRSAPPQRSRPDAAAAETSDSGCIVS